jgi:hypothetical protein
MDSPTYSAFGTVAVRVVVLAYVKVTSPLIEHCIRLLYQRLPSNVDHLKVSILGCCQPPVTICQLDLWSHKASPVPALRVHGVRCLDAWETLVTSSSARARTNTHTHTHTRLWTDREGPPKPPPFTVSTSISSITTNHHKQQKHHQHSTHTHTHTALPRSCSIPTTTTMHHCILTATTPTTTSKLLPPSPPGLVLHVPPPRRLPTLLFGHDYLACKSPGRHCAPY